MAHAALSRLSLSGSNGADWERRKGRTYSSGAPGTRAYQFDTGALRDLIELHRSIVGEQEDRGWLPSERIGHQALVVLDLSYHAQIPPLCPGLDLDHVGCATGIMGDDVRACGPEVCVAVDRPVLASQDIGHDIDDPIVRLEPDELSESLDHRHFNSLLRKIIAKRPNDSMATASAVIDP